MCVVAVAVKTLSLQQRWDWLDIFRVCIIDQSIYDYENQQ